MSLALWSVMEDYVGLGVEGLIQDARNTNNMPVIQVEVIGSKGNSF